MDAPVPLSQSSNIPMDRLVSFATGQPLADRMEGAILFADISGFTPMTERLVRQYGPRRGAEELHHRLERVFTAMIGQVHAHHGSVISFLGDAILCWFDQDYRGATLACALAIKRALSEVEEELSPTEILPPVEVKIVVCSGTVRRFIIGDPEIQQIDVLAGSLLDRVTAASAVVNRNEVIIGAELLAGVGAAAEIGEWRVSPNQEHFAVVTGLSQHAEHVSWEPLPDLDGKVPGKWIQDAVRHKIAVEGREMAAELRSPAVFFLAFEGLSYDADPAAGEKLDAFVRRVQAVVARYEGLTIQVAMGDKGSCLLGAFGAVISHEDDATRCVEAALRLRDVASSTPQIESIRIGIGQGLAYAGEYGSAVRRTYGVLGSEVNIASRLMDLAAAGQILVSPRIRAKASAAFKFVPLGDRSVKGVAAPLAVFEVLPRRSRPRVPLHRAHGEAPILGRAEEMTFFQERLADLHEGTGSLVVIEGEAGIGKSRLAAAIEAVAEERGITVLVGEGDSIERVTPYFAWRPVFNQILGIEEDAPVEAVAALARGLVGEGSFAAQHLPLLHAVLPAFSLPDNDKTSQMTGTVRADATVEVLFGLLTAAVRGASSPTLLILEDVHWLDSNSWALVLALRERLPRLMAVVAARPPEVGHAREYERLVGDPETHVVRLSPLTRSDIAELIRDRLGADELPETITGLIWAKGEGNPFYSEELAYAASDTGVLEVTDGVAVLSSQWSKYQVSALPLTVREVTTSRIDRLSPQLQSLLKVASVIGRVFSHGAIRDILVLDDEAELAEGLALLEERRLIFTERRGAEPRYAFAHAITRDVVYDTLLFSQRRVLHRRIACWHERRYADELSAHAPVLAHHWDRAGDASKAVEYLALSGEEALRSYSNYEASRFYQKLLSMVDEESVCVQPARRGRWELKVGEAHVNLLQYAEGARHIERGLALLGRPVPRSKLFAGLKLGWQLLVQIAHRLLPRAFIGRRAHDRELSLAVARAYEKLSECYYLADREPHGYYAGFCYLNVAEAAGPSAELCQSYAAVGLGLGFLPFRRLARAYLDRSMAIVGSVDDLSSSSYAELLVGFYHAGVGDWPRAEKLVSGAADRLEGIGDRRRLSDTLSVLAPTRYFRGDLVSGLDCAATLYTLNTGHVYLHNRCEALFLRGLFLLELGRFGEVAACIDECEGLLDDHPDVRDTFLTLSLLSLKAGLALRQARHEEGLAVAVEILHESRSWAPNIFTTLPAFMNAAEAVLAAWQAGVDQDGANLPALARKALRSARRYVKVFPIGRPRLLLLTGRYLELRHRLRRARKVWHAGLEAAEELQMPLESAYLLAELARTGPPGSPSVREHLAKADDIFTRTGAVRYVDQAQDRLGCSGE